MKIEELDADQIEEAKAYFEKEIAEVQNQLDHHDIEDMSEENLMQKMRLDGQLAALKYAKASFLADIERRMVTDGK